ncbi:MAG: cytochrome c [Gammaproteobacteria bacterium]|nr:cytochrome c [Gammaproteobacteria bacterium]
MERHTRIPALILALFLVTGGAGIAWGKGDVERGKRLARECFACHGQDGYSPSPINPKIGGQHERYLFLSLKEYRDGGRSHSLMRGSVLSRTDQELEDIAAYYASQPGYLTPEEIWERKQEGLPAAAGPPAGAQRGGPPRGPAGPRKFDHSDHIARYNSMLAQAIADAARAAGEVGESACQGLSGSADSDADGDGLADAYDAAPGDAGEFVLDTNADGFFEICDIRQLEAIGNLGRQDGKATTLDREVRMTRKYQLVRDLDASSIPNFEPIGDCGPEGNCMITLDRYGFQGVIDGRGHTIRGLRISRPGGGGIGLLGVLGAQGTVRDLVLEDALVIGRGGAALLVGSNFGIVFGCRAEGEVAGDLALGILVGGSGGLVAFSESSGTVSGNQALGGLIGDMRGGVYHSRSSGEVSGSRGLGGLVGLNTFGLVAGSYATGAVIGGNDLGGLVGMNTDAKVRNSFSTARVEGDGSNIGGLVGFNSLSEVRNSYATGPVFGADAVGGLIGRNNGSVRMSYAASRVVSEGASGGISGVTVEGEEELNFWSSAAHSEGASALNLLTAEDSGWIPAAGDYLGLIDAYCDANANGFIDPQERRPDNRIWDFGDAAQSPTIRCTAVVEELWGGKKGD